MNEQNPIESATPEDTRREMTRLAARGYVQLRHILVQKPEGERRGSTLGSAVHTRKHRALVLYLLLLTCWPWLEKNHRPLAADTWIRALTSKRGLTWSPSTLSRAWADLEELGLIEERAREGRSVRVTPRREDGGARYDAPGGRADWANAYFIIPDSFWKDELFARLSLPGLAMLLVVAKETNKKGEMYLPYSKADEWYGLSPKTVQNGLKELDKLGLLHKREEVIKAPLSKTGMTTRVWYSLTGDFGSDARASLQKRAQSERSKRLAKEAPKPRKAKTSRSTRVRTRAKKS
ncbi:MAG: hypothetical protein ACYCTH_08520 [Cellulomonas sp.]